MGVVLANTRSAEVEVSVSANGTPLDRDVISKVVVDNRLLPAAAIAKVCTPAVVETTFINIVTAISLTGKEGDVTICSSSVAFGCTAAATLLLKSPLVAAEILIGTVSLM